MGQRLPPLGSGRNPKAGAIVSTTGSPRRATEGPTTSARDSWDPGPAEEQAVRAAHMAAVTCRTFCMHELKVGLGFWCQGSDACNGEQLLGALAGVQSYQGQGDATGKGAPACARDTPSPCALEGHCPLGRESSYESIPVLPGTELSSHACVQHRFVLQSVSTEHACRYHRAMCAQHSMWGWTYHALGSPALRSDMGG